jgi:glycine cleavage system H protein
MYFPPECKYSKEHIWLKPIDNQEALIGVTDFAQSQILNDVIFIDLQPTGKKLKAGAVFAKIESVLAMEDEAIQFPIPVDGKITSINTDLRDKPEWVNTLPYNQGWLIKIKLDNPQQMNSLMNAEDYEASIDQ